MARDDIMTVIVVDAVTRHYGHTCTVVAVGCDCFNGQVDLWLDGNLHGRAFIVVGVDFGVVVWPIHSYLDVIDSNGTTYVKIQCVVLAAVYCIVHVLGVDDFAVIQKLYGNVIIGIVSIPRVGSEGHLDGFILITGRRCNLKTRYRELIILVYGCRGRGAVVIGIVLAVSVRPVDSCSNGLRTKGCHGNGIGVAVSSVCGEVHVFALDNGVAHEKLDKDIVIGNVHIPVVRDEGNRHIVALIYRAR